MESELVTARIAHADMVATITASEVNEQTTNRITIGRAIVGRAVMATVEKAMEVAGSSAFYRDTAAGPPLPALYGPQTRSGRFAIYSPGSTRARTSGRGAIDRVAPRERLLTG